jgi:hypothetical protein
MSRGAQDRGGADGSIAGLDSRGVDASITCLERTSNHIDAAPGKKVGDVRAERALLLQVRLLSNFCTNVPFVPSERPLCSVPFVPPGALPCN